MKLIFTLLSISFGIILPWSIQLISFVLLTQSDYMNDDMLDYLLIVTINEQFNFEIVRT